VTARFAVHSLGQEICLVRETSLLYQTRKRPASEVHPGPGAGADPDSIAFVVYFKLGLGLLRKAWFNLDVGWSLALLASGAAALWL
jgi:hypothetical protein